MDFLEDLELYNTAMENAYNVITGKITLDQVYIDIEDSDEDLEFPLPFNPFLHEDVSDEEIDEIIDHFVELEEYEKCQDLVNCKNAKNVKKHK
jgi:hypothetical protein|tara:strand:+ start:654 stop:932 length:279 start_codon:yes stop_codon:yes gene_type:complete